MENKGIAMPALLAIVFAVLVAGGALYYNTRPEAEKMMEMGEAMVEDGESMVKEGEAMIEEGEKMMEEGEAMMEEENTTMNGSGSDNGDVGFMSPAGISYYGEVLSESSDGAVLLDFNQSDYENAIMNEKLVALYFYANWCPTCKLEFPKMIDAFKKLPSGVVGFRVNYNDSQTDNYEKGLARQFGVAYQHTKVFVKNGERILKSPESWDEERYITEITNAL